MVVLQYTILSKNLHSTILKICINKLGKKQANIYLHHQSGRERKVPFEKGKEKAQNLYLTFFETI